MHARNLGVVFGRESNLLAMTDQLLTCPYSNADAFARPRRRVQRYGRQGTLHRMACRERTTGFRAAAARLMSPNSPHDMPL